MKWKTHWTVVVYVNQKMSTIYNYMCYKTIVIYCTRLTHIKDAWYYTPAVLPSFVVYIYICIYIASRDEGVIFSHGFCLDWKLLYTCVFYRHNRLLKIVKSRQFYLLENSFVESSTRLVKRSVVYKLKPRLVVWYPLYTCVYVCIGYIVNVFNY